MTHIKQYTTHSNDLKICSINIVEDRK